jgi:NADPH-dependent ferric siderophore reductase
VATIDGARREPPPFRSVAVRSTEPLTPHLVRIVLAGADLTGFEIEGPASSVRLLLPPDGSDTVVIPHWTGNQFELPTGGRAPIRTFTPRHFDSDRLELTLDLVLHDSGAASDWARRAAPGTVVAVSGPGRGYIVDNSATSMVLGGDETALPAISQLLETLPEAMALRVELEVSTPTARLPLPGHPGAEINWHDLDRGAAPGTALVAAIRSIDDQPDTWWIAGEAAAVQKIRKHLFDARGIPRSMATVRGYWKHGRSAT